MKKDYVSLRRRPFLTPLWLAALAAMMVVALATWLWITADSTVVIVIRHAEPRSGGSAADLSAAGLARAALLVRMFGDAAPQGRLDALFVSSAVLGPPTAAPLAARLGLTPIVVPADAPSALAHRAVHDFSGGSVLIIADRANLAQIVGALSGGDSITPIDASDYGTMYIVTVPHIGHANLLRLTY